MTPMLIIWVVLLVGAVAVLAVLVARRLRGGDREVGMPTSVGVGTHDEPVPGSDADIAHRKRDRKDSGVERAHDLFDIDRTLGPS